MRVSHGGKKMFQSVQSTAEFESHFQRKAHVANLPCPAV